MGRRQQWLSTLVRLVFRSRQLPATVRNQNGVMSENQICSESIWLQARPEPAVMQRYIARSALCNVVLTCHERGDGSPRFQRDGVFGHYGVIRVDVYNNRAHQTLSGA